MRIFTFLLCLLCFLNSAAYSNGIESYTPPSMFSNSGYEANIDLPPLPPRRPTKMHVPQSYIKKLRAQDSLQHDLQNALDTIDSHDVLEQINPRK